MATDRTLQDRVEIREAAYRIWQAEGCSGGCEVDHWLRAEREVRLRHDGAGKAPGDGSVPQLASRTPSSAADAGRERAADLPVL